ncbi:uncharacterized protein [Montipora foliosa]|uniref:uncharacterized protein n=1 Tax=Montipora foliosa TaxID=591990 RepID=UPI0035F1D527
MPSLVFFLVLDLAQTDVYTIEDLLRAMESCLTTIKAFPFLLDIVFDVKEWSSPHANELHSHTHPKCFKFVRNEGGSCVMFYRNYSHMKWEGPQQLLKSMPTSKPNLIQPSLSKIYADALRRDVRKFQDNYPKGVFEAWSQWVQNINKRLQLPTEWEWPLDILQNCDKLMPAIQDVALPGHLIARASHRMRKKIKDYAEIFGHIMGKQLR